MKTASTKALEFMRDYENVCASNFHKALVKLLKEQDRDTRHACAAAVAEVYDLKDDYMIHVGDAHNACMNVTAV